MARPLFIALVLIFALPARAQILVTLTNDWRYNQTETNFGTAWRLTDYDDASWPVGSAVFHEGYRGSGPQTSYLRTRLSLTNSAGEQMVTHYFRTHFAYNGSPGPIWLGLTNFVDDGMVLYLNGSEVYRFNMPAGDPSYGTFALMPIDNASLMGASFQATNLVSGDNVLCTEVHKHGGETRDVVFGLQLAVVAPPAITAQPQSLVIARTYDATFTVGTTNNLTPLSYQWLKEGIEISGATNAAYTVADAQYAHVGLYSVRMSNVLGQALSFNASLKVVPAYHFVTLAGFPGTMGTNDGVGNQALFSTPYGVALDSDGDLYVNDLNNHTIRRVTADGLVKTLAGRTGISGHQDGGGSDALFWLPTKSAVDKAGNVFVADQANHVIRRVSPDGAVTTIAGAPQQAGSLDGTNDIARFNNPSGVVIDAEGNLFVAGGSAHSISMITPVGTNWVVRRIVGGGGNQRGTVDGINFAARFRFPAAIDIDHEGNLYVADGVADNIRKVQRSGTNWVVSTLAGVGLQEGHIDGLGSAARFDSPYGIAVDRYGNVFVADSDNHTIRKITSDGWVSTIGGLAGFSGAANSEGSRARFNQPRGIAVDSLGNLYVADGNNHTIRMGWSENATPVISLGTPVVSSNKVEIPVRVKTGTVSNFGLLHAPSPEGPWTTNASALFTQPIPGLIYRFSAPPDGEKSFYRFYAR